MTGSRVQVRLGIVMRSLILVVDEETDGRSERDAILGSRLDVDEVVLVSLQVGISRESWNGETRAEYEFGEEGKSSVDESR